VKPEPEQIIRARVRMALWLLVFYLITMVEGYLTFPFVGFTSSMQNVIWGAAVASPFWISIIVFLIIVRRKES
jgi:hypothetical protein